MALCLMKRLRLKVNFHRQSPNHPRTALLPQFCPLAKNRKNILPVRLWSFFNFVENRF